MGTTGPPSSIYRSLQVISVSVLERSTLADLYCYCTEVRSNTGQGQIWGTDWFETTDDKCEIMLMFGPKAFDDRNGIRPNPEEGEEQFGAIVLR